MSIESLERAVLDRIEVTPADLRELAAARTQVVKNALARAGISPERLFVGAGSRILVGDGAGDVVVELLL